jgi:ribonuclease P protein component
MISYRFRFHGYGSLGYVYKKGYYQNSDNVTIKYVTNTRRKHPRIAVVVSKKIYKSAVRRNRIRRRVFAVIESRIPDFTQNHDLAVIVNTKETFSIDSGKLEAEIVSLLKKSGIIA